MPLKNNTSAAVAGGGEPPYDGGLEHRMTALETRLDTILPTLATKADVEAVRADVNKLAMSTNAQLGELRAELDKATLSTDAKFGELRAELDKATLSTDAKLGELRADMHKMNAEIKSWTLATIITIVGTMLAAIFGISQIYKGATPASPAPIIITIPVPSAPAAPANTK
jgi:Mg2+ and Co2+ transporter CorA